MPVRRHSRNRSGRIDPALPTLPPPVPVRFTAAGVVGTITAYNGDVISYNSQNAAVDDALPGMSVIAAGGEFLATAVEATAPNVITATFGGTITSGTLNLAPNFVAIRSQKGGVISLGLSKF